MDSRPFPVKGRYILLLWLVPPFYLPGLDQLYSFMHQSAEWYWYDLSFYYYAHALFILSLGALVFFHKVEWRSMFGQVKKPDIVLALKLTAFIFAFSIASTYLLFYPLSYIVPDFVRYWYIDIPPVIYNVSGRYPIAPNILSFASLVVLAPAIEEFAFRGILFRRWKDKWGMMKAVWISSALFGIIHPDPIGATAFGVAMCVVYSKSKSLWTPMICHAANNMVVWFIEAGYLIHYGPGYTYTLEDFREEWFIGVICALIVFVVAYDYTKKTQVSEMQQFFKA